MVSQEQTSPKESTATPPWWRGPAVFWFAVAAALRLIYVLALREHPRFEAPTMDAGYHLAWARTVASGETFQEGPFFRAPLYPYFLSFWTALSPDSTLLARLAQSVLGATGAALTASLAQRVMGRASAWWAGGFVALSPVMVAFDAELLIPALLVPLLLLALNRCVVWGGERGGWQALGTGALFGLAAIARPNVLLFMPVLFALALVRTRRPAAGLMLALGTLIPIAPVTLTNLVSGDAALISTQAGVNFWIGNNPESDGVTAIVPGTRQGWWDGYHDAISLAEAEEGRELRPSEVSRYYAGKALSWMAGDPAKAASLLAWKARLLVANVELANNQDIEFTARRTLPPLRYSPSRWDVLLGLGVVGLVLAWRRRRGGAGMLLGFVAVYGVSIVLFFVNARFRVPLSPVLAVGAGYALSQLAASLRSRDLRGVAAVGFPAVILMALSNLIPAAVNQSEAAGFADLGRAELARGDAGAALTWLTKATSLEPRSVQIRMALSSAILEATGDGERALRSLREVEAFATAKDRVELEARIFALRLRVGEAQAVLADVAVARRARPTDGSLRFVYAMAQSACGQAPGAIATLGELLEAEPTNIAAALFRGQLQETLGLTEEARETYEGAASRGQLSTPSEAAAIAAGLARCAPE